MTESHMSFSKTLDGFGDIFPLFFQYPQTFTEHCQSESLAGSYLSLVTCDTTTYMWRQEEVC